MNGILLSGFDRIGMAFGGVPMEPVPKGELWLGTKVLERAGFEDDVLGHIRLVEYLHQDMICLPTARHTDCNRSLGYRYFTVKELRETREKTELFVTAVVDGPFQRLVEKEGLTNVLTGWAVERDNVLKAYETERGNVLRLLEDCLGCSVHGVVIADDLAWDRSTLLDPDDIEEYFSPFYVEAISGIHDRGARALFHSCGNIKKLIPWLITWGFDGLSAIQDGTNDLMQLRSTYGSELVLMAGIDGEVLEEEKLSPYKLETLRKRFALLAQNGGFILSSACGLYRGRFLERIRNIYDFETVKKPISA